MRIDPAALRALDVYHLMTSILIPRPIAWVGTRSADGIDNLAPFSYFMGVSSRPPALAISVSRLRGGALKDTARNILETGVFTVSMVPVALADRMNHTAAAWPAAASEFEAAGLTAAESDAVAAPYPAESPVSMACKLVHAHDMGSTHLLVGEITLFLLDDAVLGEDGRVVARRLDPLARLGGQGYAGLGEIFSLARPPDPS